MDAGCGALRGVSAAAHGAQLHTVGRQGEGWGVGVEARGRLLEASQWNNWAVAVELGRAMRCYARTPPRPARDAAQRWD